MRLFQQFSFAGSDEFVRMINSFFGIVRKTISKSIDDSEKKVDSLRKLSDVLEAMNIDVSKKSNLYGTGNLVIGGLYDIKFDFGEKFFHDYIELKDVILLVPDKDGYFYFEGSKLYSPFVVFDGFSTSDELEVFEENESVDDLSMKEILEKSINLSESIVLQGYYLNFLFALLRIVYERVRDRRVNSSFRSALLNQLVQKIGVIFSRYYSKTGRWLAVKVPNFFLADELNDISYNSEPRKVIYPNEQVNDNLRLPHSSHFGIVDLLETPESDKIGLTLTLIDSDDLSFDFDNLRIVNKRFTISDLLNGNISSPDFLSFATKQIPFILHSDAARMLMGSKNLKQVIPVEEAEEPIIKTGFETQKYGVNALVGYGLFYGFNFEDGIVVSESFAKKMRVKIKESEKFTEEFISAKSFTFNEGKWKFVGNKVEAIIEWKVKPGESVYYGKELFEVTIKEDEKKKKSWIRTYEGRYEARVVNLPKDAFPVPSAVFDEYVISFYIDFEVYKPLEVGDKLMGRHGNKGTVSLILPDEQMPEVEIGGNRYKLDVILSPLGVVSRMNLGQLYETHCSVAVKHANFNLPIPISPLENMSSRSNELLDSLRSIGADKYGRFRVYYNGNVWYLTAGYQYMVRLDHCVRDKIHVVDIAAESELTGQPKKGKSNNGGQKFGELEFWSLQSYANRKLTKLFAQKNLSSLAKGKKANLTVYPEDILNEIFDYVFGIRFELKSNGSSNCSCFKLANNVNTKLNVDLELLKIYVDSALRNLDRDTKRKFGLYRIWYMMQKSPDVNQEIEQFFDLLENFVGKESKSVDDIKEIDKFINHSKYLEAVFEHVSEFESVKNGIKLSHGPNGNVEKFAKLIENFWNKIVVVLKEVKAEGSKRADFKYIEDKIKKLLFKKEGFVREIVIARRLHYSARTVISPMPLSKLDLEGLVVDLDVDTVILPVDFGIAWLKDRISVISKDKVERALRGDSKERKEIARLLTKELISDDIYVVLIRQPAIHRHSVQAFRPVFWQNYTIGLPINVCEGFNADFDGDTMAVIYPTEQTEDIKEELRSMLPSRNPFKLGNGELIYSIDQDMVYGYYCETGKEKKALKSEADKVIRDYARQGKYDEIKEYIKSTILDKYVRLATERNLTLSIFEILNNTGSFEAIKKSKCRGNDKQYKQLNFEISVEERKIQTGFVQGLSVKDYFNPEDGLVRRARRTLMDKKLKVADAGYLTRKLVEFVGAIKTSDNTDEFVEINIDLSTLPNGFDKKRFLYRYIKVGDEVRFVESEDMIPDRFVLLSPKVVEIGNGWYISKKWCGFDVSRLKEFNDNEYIGISAGHVIGERGTQLSMETFHTGGKGLNMASVRESILRNAFNSENYSKFLENVSKDFQRDMGEGYHLFSYLDSKSLYFELIYNFAQYIKGFGITRPGDYHSNIDLRGALTCMSFERGLDIIKEIEIGKDYEEKHPRVEYSFFWRWM
ncbi:hypothetical protein MNL76_08470 [Fervidobacterium riparium]|uniref:DNA-directed RNA polymerase n=1 Tax=Fervidobacterium gondwanense DSM 13020 TaxID=1121883 RepID=A0A1M7TEZ3_FERGO|nr:hypothetical protein [Fervidobacterium gondwanense]UXF01865.1 hypothetical protein IB67_10230 [Fervidobacterium riparium]SHN69332.1 RNA polymerase Rpb1, domain 5 [Fervidobacterium gondwanense DSM 13020]